MEEGAHWCGGVGKKNIYNTFTLKACVKLKFRAAGLRFGMMMVK